ncbi:hypothetical protein GCM10012284_59660 [Mangrovihabitans endophyticus]|uniref:NodB homology domain-containing protein n=2 Tax=Mangrovihabitans endophyticus TaxID=1751298 RepID=A0A8J3FRI6_9ACTN|nr:hypothetical protein GCM10012284_59660 [Mangrovihabitans endophyticus]
MRAGLWMLAVVIVVVPVGAALYLLNRDRLPDQVLSPQPPPVDPAAAAAWRDMGAGLPAEAPPVVLSYHDIHPGSTDRYVVSPGLFERQLMALRAAGYRTLTSRQYANYLQGDRPGPRSVYLTFDDGTAGLYRYADPVLRRQAAHGASYLISGRVGRHQPYYLTWLEVRTMASSGRWDFQAHTHDLHRRGPTGPERVPASMLTGRAWTADGSRPETDAEHRARVATDIAAQLRDFRKQALPKPLLFAYPFSDAGSARDRATVRVTASLLARTYAGTFTNVSALPAPTSRRSTAGGRIQRIEVFRDTTPEDLVRQVRSWTAVSPAGLNPLGDRQRWFDPWKERRVSVADLTDGTPAPKRTYAEAAYAPYASADWCGYRLTASVTGLSPRGNNANVTVRWGGVAPVVIRVAYGSVQVVDHTGVVVAARPAGARRHRLRVDVGATSTEVQVDGVSVGNVPDGAGARSCGGVVVALRRDPDASPPRFTSLTLKSRV